jgi:hypothetical protein
MLLTIDRLHLVLVARFQLTDSPNHTPIARVVKAESEKLVLIATYSPSFGAE